MKQFESIAEHATKRIRAIDTELARIKQFHPKEYARTAQEVAFEELDKSVKATLAIEGIYV